MKKDFMETVIMHLIAKKQFLYLGIAIFVIATVSYNISTGLVLKNLKKNEVIEVGYTENVLAKLAESNSKPVVKTEKKEVEQPVQEEEVLPSVEEPTLEEQPVYEEPVVTEPVLTVQSNVELGTQIADFATQHVGNPYAYGGSSLTTGADCSGFVMAVYSSFGISLPRTAYDQSNSGTQVSLDYLQPGDLIFYGYGSITHAALYIGNGQIVHAMNEAMGINISSYTFMPIIKAVRVI